MYKIIYDKLGRIIDYAPMDERFVAIGYDPQVLSEAEVEDFPFSPEASHYIYENGGVTAVMRENISESQLGRTLTYKKMVEAFIRERYSVSDELAILRQRYTKPEEFEEYNAFCEECKARAKSQTTT